MLKPSDLKAVKVSINVSDFSCVVHFFAMLKRTSIYKNYLLSQKKISPSLANLGAQITWAQNRYAALQTDLNCPLSSGRDCGLIALFQLYGFKAAFVESNLFWVR